MIEIYTDGAYNPGLDQGGWAAIVLEGGQKHAFSGAVKKTTSNRMEIAAALEGIEHTPQNAEVVVYTDSQYLFGSVTKGWKRRVNNDLWDQLDEVVSKRKMRWQWISRDTENDSHKEAHNLATTKASQGEAGGTASSEKLETQPAKSLTHVDAQGRPRMVDVSGKTDTQREAVARGRVIMQASTFAMLKKGDMAKGDVLTVAQLAGTMAAKQTSQIIPLCHPIPIGYVNVEFGLDEKNSAVEITAAVKSTGKTGAEMEALTAVAVAALTIYDMCKAVERGIKIDNIRLVRKSGGKSGTIDLGT